MDETMQKTMIVVGELASPLYDATAYENPYDPNNDSVCDRWWISAGTVVLVLDIRESGLRTIECCILQPNVSRLGWVDIDILVGLTMDTVIT